jgi:hypothetical protein
VSIQYLSLPDCLLIAEWVLGQSAEAIVRLCGLGLAESALHAPPVSFAGLDF